MHLLIVVETNGNPSCHIILRGSNSGPNFAAEHVKKTADQLAKARLPTKVMIDCSHGNSEKKHERQVGVAEDIARQLGEKETGENITGVMIESHLVAGELVALALYRSTFLTASYLLSSFRSFPPLLLRRSSLSSPSLSPCLLSSARTQASNPSPPADPSASPTANPSRTPASTGPRPSPRSTRSARECRLVASSWAHDRASIGRLMDRGRGSRVLKVRGISMMSIALPGLRRRRSREGWGGFEVDLKLMGVESDTFVHYVDFRVIVRGGRESIGLAAACRRRLSETESKSWRGAGGSLYKGSNTHRVT